jgi:hypothetical protein
VFDSLAPKRSERQLEKLGKVSPIIVNHIFWRSQ